jgi:hypothetical protein
MMIKYSECAFPNLAKVGREVELLQKRDYEIQKNSSKLNYFLKVKLTGPRM